jgi:hypothetical protein
MIREKITSKDYERISKENEYYIWHFTPSDIGIGVIYSIFKERMNSNGGHMMRSILEIYDVPYYESEIKDNLDFLDMLGVPLQSLWVKQAKEFNPFILAFNRKRLVAATFQGYCMCPEGITELLLKLNPEIVLNANLD